MAGVAGAAQHQIEAVHLPGEENAVAVIGQEGIFQLVEGLEVLRPAHANGGTMVAVAPGDIVLPVHIAYPGIVAVLSHGDNGIAFKGNGLVLNLPGNAVLAKAHKKVHAD